MAETINIATISVDVNAFITEAKKAKEELIRLTEANNALKKSGETSSTTFIENEIAIKKLRQEYNQNVKSAESLTVATDEVNKAMQTESKSVQQVIQDRNKLIALSKNIKGDTEEEVALRKKLNTAIDTQTEFIRKNQSQYSASKDMIGEYKQALSTLSPTLGSILGTVTQLRDAFIKQKEVIVTNIALTKEKIAQDKAMAVSQGIVSKSIIGVNGALKLFKIALISTGIGAIIVALGSLITYLASTQEGIDKITSVTRPLQAVFQSLLGLFQNVGKSLFEAFSKPKVVLNDLVDFIKTNLINRFKAFAVIIEGIKNFDFKQITNGALQLSTGVENLTDKVKKAGQETAKFFTDSAKKGSQIDKLQKDIEKSTLKFNEAQIKVNDQLDELNLISKDTSKSFKEREDAAKRIIEITKANGEEEAKIIQKQIEKIKLEQSLNDTKRTGNQELIDLQIKLDDAKDRGLEAEKEQLRTLAGARKEDVQKQKEYLTQQEQLKDQAFQKQQQQLNEELELFLANQGIKAKTLSEEVVIAQEVANKKQEILDNELANGKISQEKYKTESLKISQELAGKQAELASENAFNQAEVERLQIEQTILNEREKNARLLEIEKQYQADRLAQGLISQTEYNTLINELNEENRLRNIELENERIAIDKENQIASEMLSFEEAQQRRRDELEERKALELSEAEKTGANKNLIEAKFKKYSQDLERELVDQKIELAKSGLNSLSEILGKESKAGKAVAIAQALINTYQGITKALTLPFPANIAAAATTSVTGFKAVKEITKTKTPEVPKAERGAMIGGLPHAQGGTIIEAERGEAIINANSVSRFKPLLSAINQAGGGVSFGASAQTQNDLINYDAIGRQFRSALVDMPSPVVAVEEIKDVTRKYTKVVERASI